MLVTSRCSLSAKIQPETISTNATADPLVPRQRAQFGEGRAGRDRGLRRVRDGRNRRATSHGSATIAVSAGTQETTSHLPKPTSSPYSRTTDRRLAEVAVIQSAGTDTWGDASRIEQNIR